MENDNDFLIDDVILNEYIDGTLDDAARLRLEARLAADPSLTQRLDQLRSTVDQLAIFGNQVWPLNVDLGPRVLNALQPEPMRSPMRPPMLQPMLRWIMLAQLVAGLVLLVILLPRFVGATFSTLPLGLNQAVGQWAEWIASLTLVQPPAVPSVLPVWSTVWATMSAWPTQSAQAFSTIGICSGVMILFWLLSNSLLLRRAPRVAMPRENND